MHSVRWKERLAQRQRDRGRQGRESGEIRKLQRDSFYYFVFDMFVDVRRKPQVLLNVLNTNP